MHLNQLVDKARESQLFTAPVLAPHLKTFLEEHAAEMRSLAQRAHSKGVRHFYWVGSGNSWVNLFPGKYLLDRFTSLPTDVFTAYEFTWRHPRRLGADTWVFLSSYSGATEDTVAALRFANAQGAYTIALVNKADSLMGKEARYTIPYNSKALFILPMAAVYLFALELARLEGASGTAEIVDGLHALPELFARQYAAEEAVQKGNAEAFLEEHLVYTLGCGPLYGLAYKFGLTVFMENMRVNGSFIETSEFRHGPVEMFDREKPAIVSVKGTDESRSLSERVEAICLANGARLLVFDAASYPGVHPLLSPFSLMIPLQWFAVWSTLLRGIEDLDERVLMGRGLLGRGQGVTWP
jgi:fructoselysine-6-P-deglycase FrlB-like protein